DGARCPRFQQSYLLLYYGAEGCSIFPATGFSFMDRNWPNARFFVAANTILIGCSILTACSILATRGSPERRIIDDAAQALGGKEQILALKTLTIEGEASDTNLGQNVTPEGDLPVWKVSEYKQTIDAGGTRMRIRQMRSAQFLFALATVQKQDQGFEG